VTTIPHKSLISKILKEVEKAHLRAFKSSSSLTSEQTVGEILRARTRAVLLANRQLPPQPSEISELLMDRLLLRISASYRATRQYVSLLGIELVPQIRSVQRALTTFDMHTGRLGYSPIESELFWATEKPGDPKRLLHFQQLTHFNVPLFHDLNHLVLFRLIHPDPVARPTDQVIRHYYSLIEALVIIRDLEIAYELGPLSVVLNENGILYRCIRKTMPVDWKMDFDFFKTALLFTFYEVAYAASRERTVRFIEGTGMPSPHKVLGTNASFLEDISPRWVKDYLDRYGRTLRPAGAKPVPRAAARLEFDFKVKSPEQLAKDERQFRAFYEWYRRVYSPSLFL